MVFGNGPDGWGALSPDGGSADLIGRHLGVALALGSVRPLWHGAVKLVSAFVYGKRRDLVTGGVMSEASFDRVISEHLALRERNRRLERGMPLDRYREQGDDGSMTRASPGARPNDEPETETETIVNARQEHWLDSESLWDATGQRPLPEFDWGDG